MIRDEWKFAYTASKVADGAEKQMQFRAERVAAWQEAKAKLMAEVKESGLEVVESVAAQMGSTYAVSNARGGPTINVRADLQMKLQECHSKIEQHQRAVNEYDGWVQVLRANPEQRLDLSQDDWLYFFGKV